MGRGGCPRHAARRARASGSPPRHCSTMRAARLSAAAGRCNRTGRPRALAAARMQSRSRCSPPRVARAAPSPPGRPRPAPPPADMGRVMDVSAKRPTLFELRHLKRISERDPLDARHESPHRRSRRRSCSTVQRPSARHRHLPWRTTTGGGGGRGGGNDGGSGNGYSGPVGRPARHGRKRAWTCG